MSTVTKQEKKIFLQIKAKGRIPVDKFSDQIRGIYDELYNYIQNITNIQQKLREYNNMMGTNYEIPELYNASKAVRQMARHFEFVEEDFRACRNYRNLLKLCEEGRERAKATKVPKKRGRKKKLTYMY